MTNRIVLVVTLMLLAVLETGCIGISGGRVNFDELKYPASLSNSLYGPAGEIVKQGDRRLEIIQDFKYTMDYCSVFYSLIPLSRSRDIIDVMNAEIERAGGGGMINVSIAAEYSKLTSVLVLNMLPIWPGCSEIRVKGAIVKFAE